MGWESVAGLFVAGLAIFLQLHRISALGVNELLYFRILSPPDIGYIFSAAPARDFGSDFTSSYDEIFLVPAEPVDGCSELKNKDLIEGQVTLLERGGCSFVRKARVVEEAGGRAVLIADDASDNDSQYLDMITDGTADRPSIPALFLLGRDGMMIRRSLQTERVTSGVITQKVRRLRARSRDPLTPSSWSEWSPWKNVTRRTSKRKDREMSGETVSLSFRKNDAVICQRKRKGKKKSR